MFRYDPNKIWTRFRVFFKNAAIGPAIADITSLEN